MAARTTVPAALGAVLALAAASAGAAAVHHHDESLHAHQAHDCIHDKAGISDFVHSRRQHMIAPQNYGLGPGVPHPSDSGIASNASAAEAAVNAAAHARVLQTTFSSIRITLDLSRLEYNAYVLARPRAARLG
jgi:hypothetical protein